MRPPLVCLSVVPPKFWGFTRGLSVVLHIGLIVSCNVLPLPTGLKRVLPFASLLLATIASVESPQKTKESPVAIVTTTESIQKFQEGQTAQATHQHQDQEPSSSKTSLKSSTAPTSISTAQHNNTTVSHLLGH